jgi:RHS repeat-associated protein
VGFRFTVGGTALTVTELGRWVVSGNSGNHVVKLFNADGTAVAGGSVTVSTAGKPAGQFTYATLGSPVTLARWTTYALMTPEVNGGDWWYDYAGTTITLTGDASGAWSAWAYDNPPPYYLDLNGGGKSHGPVNLKCAWGLSTETRYVYDGMLAIQERSSANTPTVTYTRGLDLSGTLQEAGGIGGLLGRSHGYVAGTGAWSYHNFYQADAGGNVAAMANNHATAAALVAQYRYDPFGRIFYQSGTLASANVYRFSSKAQMPNSGLYYYGFRFYDPLTQRWLNRDPMEESAGANLYSYVHNSPIGNTDIYGENALTIGPITIPIPFTTEWWERNCQADHERQHRADWLSGLPGWKKEKRAFAAEIPGIQDRLRRYQGLLDYLRNCPCRNPKAEQNLEDAINGLNAELQTAESLANSNEAAMDYWNAGRRWYQSPVSPPQPLPPGYMPPPSNVHRNAPPWIRWP